MLLTKEVEVKPTGKMIQYYKDKGYNAKHKESLMVKVEDLPKHSDIRIEVLCDYCNENIVYIKYSDYIKGIKNIKSHACSKCRYEKIKDVSLKLYGVECIGSLLETKEKRERTCLDRYNVKNYTMTEEGKEKQRQSLLNNYGVDNPSKSSIIRKRTINTNLKKYGVPYPPQSMEVREKSTQTLYNNSSQKVSKQQRYICDLYGGILNYPISYYNVDIYLQNDNLIIEYDGGGHLLNVVTGRETIEEHNRKEIIRNNVIKREGYKQMRIISLKDRIPSDIILLQMLDETKKYFSDYPEHSWIEYDIDTSVVRNAEHKDGVFFDFKKLRKINNVA